MTRVFKFFDGFLIFLILCLVGVAGYFVANSRAYLATTARITLLVGAPVFVAVALAFAFKLSREARATLSMALLFGLGSLYAFELALYLGAFRDDPWAGVPDDYDRRTPLEVVGDLLARGVEAYPVAGPETWVESPPVVEARPVMPLGEIANATIVLCNETGSYVTYESDRYGFNNPDGVWRRHRLDVALVGDSFVEGWCVDPGDSLAELIRERRPRTVNLGRSGNGPLSVLGSVREYLVRSEPRHVVWFLYEGNDFTRDLSTELNSSLLRDYLDEASFRQYLRAGAVDVDKAMRSVLDELIASAQERRDEPRRLGEPLWAAAQSVFGLQSLRARVGLKVGVGENVPPGLESRAESARLLRAVVARANHEISGWGGTLHLVYLPKLETFLRDDEPLFHGAAIRIARDLSIPFLDAYEWFAAHPNPLSLFPFNGKGPLVETVGYHYDSEGHRLVAEGVLEALEK